MAAVEREIGVKWEREEAAEVLAAAASELESLHTAVDERGTALAAAKAEAEVRLYHGLYLLSYHPPHHLVFCDIHFIICNLHAPPCDRALYHTT